MWEPVQISRRRRAATSAAVILVPVGISPCRMLPAIVGARAAYFTVAREAVGPPSAAAAAAAAGARAVHGPAVALPGSFMGSYGPVRTAAPAAAARS